MGEWLFTESSHSHRHPMKIPGSGFKTKRRKSFPTPCMLKWGDSLSQDVLEAKAANGLKEGNSQTHGRACGTLAGE